jgi:transmembrane sensor
VASPAVSAKTPPNEVDELFARADALRGSARNGEAAAALRRVVAEHPSDRRAPIAAFTLAKLELDALGLASAAANDFARAIARGLPAALREDASARRIEALARAGRREEATTAADRVGRDFPASPRRTEIGRWAGASR